MAQILVRNLEPEVVERLKQRAQSHGRSLQAEVAAILREESQKKSMEEARAEAERIRRGFGGRRFSDSAELIREDRER
ncbi:MAG: Arc family DNA-binding protein [Dehalococcoidia bacterium]